MNSHFLLFAGFLNLALSLLHIAVVIGGARWYRFFGAGESMAKMAEKKLLKPTLITLSISLVFFVWALYAWSSAGIVSRLPLMKLALVIITGIYLLRGLGGLIMPMISSHPAILENSRSFWFWSSMICLAFGVVHLVGLLEVWGSL